MTLPPVAHLPSLTLPVAHAVLGMAYPGRVLCPYCPAVGPPAPPGTRWRCRLHRRTRRAA
jgi:hypothetical protein